LFFVFLTKYLLFLENLKVDHPQNHKHITLRMNDQLLIGKK